MTILKSLVNMLFCVVLCSGEILCSDDSQDDEENIILFDFDNHKPYHNYGAFLGNDLSKISEDITEESVREAWNLIQKELPLIKDKFYVPYFSHDVIFRLREKNEIILKLSEIERNIEHMLKDFKYAENVKMVLMEARMDIRTIHAQAYAVRFSPVFALMGGYKLMDQLDNFYNVNELYGSLRYFGSGCSVGVTCYCCYFLGEVIKKMCYCCCCCDPCRCGELGVFLMGFGYDICQSLVRDVVVFSFLMIAAGSLMGWGSYEVYQQYFFNTTGVLDSFRIVNNF